MPAALRQIIHAAEDIPKSPVCEITGPIYKFIPSEFGRLLLNDGIVRIGTHSDFRKREFHGDVRGDALDGVHTAHTTLPLQHPLTIQTARSVGSPFINCSSFGFENSFEIEHRALDYSLFCAASNPNPDLFSKFKSDMCIEIIDPALFFHHITQHFAAHLGYLPTFEARAVSYRKKGLAIDGIPFDRSTPWIIKDADLYEYQNEVRARWAPSKRCRDQALDILDIQVPELREYVRLHSTAQEVGNAN